MADKSVHFLMFGIFSLLWLLAWRTFSPWHPLLMLLVTIAFGYFIEWLQYTLYFLHRSFDHYDVLADAIGGVLGILVFLLLIAVFRSKK